MINAAPRPSITTDVIPAILKNRPQWVGWRWEQRENKRTKVPLDPATGWRASTTDSATWGDFETALTHAEADDLPGIGYVFAGGITGVDLDHCRDSTTGEVESWAQAIIDALDSYTEASPSGTGVHIIAQATLPAHGRRVGEIEMYDTGRFFTVTGHHLHGTSTHVEERQEAVNHFHATTFPAKTEHERILRNGHTPCALRDAQIIDRAENARNGAKFAALWRGETAGYGSQSEADLALCRILSFWVDGDPGRIDLLFRQSGLYRDKWDREDYRARTIEKAVEGGEHYGCATSRGIPRGSDSDFPPADAFSENAPDLPPAQLAAFEVWGVIKTLADAIVTDDHFAQDDGGNLYVYDNGVYAAHGTRCVRVRVKGLLERWGMAKKWSSHRADEVAEYIRITAPLLWDRPPLDRINVLNGIVILATKERMDHTPEYLSPVQLPVTFDPQATCPQWEQFVKQTFPEDAHALAWEMLADLMQPDRSDQRGILLTGEGGNGKSVYLRAATAFVGKRNITNMSLQKLETDRFAVARLLGRLGNICADLPSVHLETTSVFKAITGGDSLQGEYKYGNGFEFIPFSRLIFSANHLPRSSDSSHAFFRRWLVVPFDNTFEGTAAIPREELDARLSGANELSGVLNKALDALPRLRTNGFTESASMKKALDEFRSTTDPLSVWIEKTIEVAPDAWVARDALNRAYAEHCRKEGLPVMAANAFGRALRRLRPDLTPAQRPWQGKAEAWCWLGIQLRDSVPPPSRLSPTALQVPQVPQVFPICNKFGESRGVEDGGGKSENNSKKPVEPVEPVTLSQQQIIYKPSQPKQEEQPL